MAVLTRPVRVIVTGGTIDKSYDPIAGALAFDATRVPTLLQEARALGALEVEVAMLVDSLDITEPQRREVLVRCQRAPEQALVVTHGTDTMVETARVLGAAAVAGDLAKTVVLTGAMVPWALGASDAAFNVGFALACAQLLPAGVYVAMNGVARPWDDARKDRALGVFRAAS